MVGHLLLDKLQMIVTVARFPVIPTDSRAMGSGRGPHGWTTWTGVVGTVARAMVGHSGNRVMVGTGTGSCVREGLVLGQGPGRSQAVEAPWWLLNDVVGIVLGWLLPLSRGVVLPAGQVFVP